MEKIRSSASMVLPWWNSSPGEAQGPAAGIGIGLGEFGQGQARLHLLIPFPQFAVQRKATHDAAANRFVGVEVAALVAVDDAQPQTPTVAWLVGDSAAWAVVGTATAEQAAGQYPGVPRKLRRLSG